MTSDIFKYIENNRNAFVNKLKQAVEIRSVSGEINKRDEVIKMAEWLKSQLDSYGADTKLINIGRQLIDGKELQLPPVVLSQLGNDSSKKTVVIYNHYDVQPAYKKDGWDSEPFEFTVEGDLMKGRGSTDDKGPLVGWLCYLESMKALNLDLPVNLKFVLEGMEESGSEGLDDLIAREANGFLANSDCVVISDNYWLTQRKPCLTYGLRGVSYFEIQINGPQADLHSGVFGGTVYEPMTDLIKLMSTLVTPNGKITIPGLNELIAPLTDDEKQRYQNMEFDVDEYKQSIGRDITVSDDKVPLLMNRMRYPSLSLHGIEGAFSGGGAKTVIPAGVKGKFSIRLVPDMDVDTVEALVKKHLHAEFDKLGSKNVLNVEQLSGGRSWLADPNHWNFRAASKAVKTVYGVEPDVSYLNLLKEFIN